jgi:hypothetical protein
VNLRSAELPTRNVIEDIQAEGNDIWKTLGSPLTMEEFHRRNNMAKIKLF